MDITALDYAAKAEEGRFLQFLHPETGDPMFDGDTAIGAMVKPFYAKSIMTDLHQMHRDELAADGVKDIRAHYVKQAAIVTSKLIGLTDNGKPATNFEWFYDITFVLGDKDSPGSFAAQVVKEAGKTDFLTSA